MNRDKRRKLVVMMLVAAAVVAGMVCVSGCVYNMMASRALAREIAETPRDPKTGIAIGAEPIELGRGSRKGVLLVHGYVGSPKDFGKLPQILAGAGYRVSAPLLPGHGTRPTDMEALTADELFDAVCRAYAGLRSECEKVAVVGFSMGSTLAVRLVRDGQAKPPDALVLASAHFGVTYRWYAVLKPETWARLTAPFVPYLIKGTRFVMVNRREAMGDLYSYRVVPVSSVLMLNRMVADVHARSPSPLPQDTLMIHAKGDRASSPGCARKFADRMGIPKTARLVLIESNHHIFHDYEREKVIGAVLRFIRERLGPAGAGPRSEGRPSVAQ